ncbi:MAG: hydantoinase B/oxoprolinase family protein, partial [Stellaceae bacterium]
PALFGPSGTETLDRAVVEEKFAALATEIAARTGTEPGAQEVAAGFLKIAVENMANAIKQISIERGYDVTEYTLCCFGGAGGQHACLVADTLGMRRVLIHPLAGVLSAYGIGLADLRAIKDYAVEQRLDETMLAEVSRVLGRLAAEGTAEMRAQGVGKDRISVLRKALVKYEGTDAPLAVDFGDAVTIKTNFDAAHQQRFGFLMPDKPLILEAVSAEIVGAGDAPEEKIEALSPAAATPLAKVALWSDGALAQAPIYDRDRMKPGQTVTGPALIREATATTVVDAGWRATLDERRYLAMERVTPLPRRAAIGTAVDPVMLEVFNNLFMAIAEQMGTALQNTAYSVNIKERLDFSCALFDRTGSLIANAPHIPVHLGSMGESVRTIIRAHGKGGDGKRKKPGDVYALNAPYNGGTHLPDITVITPVFATEDERGDSEPIFYVASRGHHADIGGITPGSMPPQSRHIDEEGVLIDDFLLVAEGRFREAEALALLAGAKYPARNPAQNIADFKAQIAASEKGVQELHRMVRHFGLDVVEAYMRHVQDNAEAAVRRALKQLKSGAFAHTMDDGAKICVRVSVDHAKERATIDFTGTSAQLESNFNAP